jgi:hypothetical protein
MEAIAVVICLVSVEVHKQTTDNEILVTSISSYEQKKYTAVYYLKQLQVTPVECFIWPELGR